MIVPVPHRYDLTGLDPPATPSGIDAAIPFSRELGQVIELPQALRNGSVPAGVATTMHQTFAVSRAFDIVANTAAADQQYAALGKGLWDLYFNFVGISDFTPGTTDAVRTAAVNITDPGGTEYTLLAAMIQLGVPFSLIERLRILFITEPWQLEVHNPATGAGQLITLRLGLTAVKLL